MLQLRRNITFSYEPHHQGVAQAFTVQWALPEVVMFHQLDSIANRQPVQLSL